MTVNNELEKMLKEVVMATFKVSVPVFACKRMKKTAKINSG
jgi:hypothetical protein